MKFLVTVNCGGYFQFISTKPSRVQLAYSDNKFFIHPDSLSILKCMVGDLVELKPHKNKKIFKNLYLYLDSEKTLHQYKDLVKRIIQRNGVAFMYPKKISKSEADYE